MEAVIGKENLGDFNVEFFDFLDDLILVGLDVAEERVQPCESD